jgi:hypothetical protein
MEMSDTLVKIAFIGDCGLYEIDDIENIIEKAINMAQ